MRTQNPLPHVLLIAFLAAALSGCIGSDEAPPGAASTEAPALLRSDATTAAASFLQFQGGPLEAPKALDGPPIVPHEPLGPGPCTGTRCAAHTFEVIEAYADDAPAELVVTVRVPPGEHHDGSLRAWLDTADGATHHADYTGFYGTRIALPLQSGSHTLTVRAESNTVLAYEVTVHTYDAPAVQPGDQLPNLVTLPPRDIQIQTESWGNLFVFPYPDVPRPVGSATGVQGCASDEYVEKQALRCLRLSNGIANIGPGALEVRITTDDAAATVTADGEFRQRIYADDGSHREIPVGDAYLHPTHAHLHYQGLADYRLHEYDEATETIGSEVGQGRKAGFCLVDEGPAAPLIMTPQDGQYSGYTCVFEEEGDWYMGLTPGWFDMYETYRSDQFIEISGVPDGVYALVSTVNRDGSLHEETLDDNAAGAIIRITGNDVELLSTWAEWMTEAV